MRELTLAEYQPRNVPTSEMSMHEGTVLWRQFGAYVEVEFPSPCTKGDWRLTPKSWVGYLPITRDFGVVVRPKLDIRSLFGMLEYAYDLKTFRLLEGDCTCDSLEEVYVRIASVLARLVRGRTRRGIFREYRGDRDRLPFLRGRLDTNRQATTPWRADLACRFEEHTADVEDNRLLLWALNLAVHSGLCAGATAGHVRDAYRSLASSVTLLEHRPHESVGRRYQRLDEDYRPMHMLGRFLVEHTGPRWTRGVHGMVPFLVDMNRLFESFVATWLQAHLPTCWQLVPQASKSMGGVSFVADLVLRERETKRPVVILDTKYKRDGVPQAGDLAQVVAYATAWGTRDAVLVYPNDSASPWEVTVGSVRVRALGFALSGDLEAAGRTFMAQLLDGRPASLT